MGFSRLRRNLLTGLPLMMALPSTQLLAQAAILAVQKLHSFGLRVSDVQRSLDFYQNLFACPIQGRDGETVYLRLGDGPHYFSLTPTQTGQAAGISHIGLSVTDFSIDTAIAILEQRGIQRLAAAALPATIEASLDVSLRYWQRQRGEGTELYFANAEGLVYQLSSSSYCGSGSSACEAPEESPTPGSMKLVDINHFTNFVANKDSANAFHTSLFGLQFQAYQGPASPIIGVGDGYQFLMFVGGSQEGVPTEPGRVDHVSLSMENFSVDNILRTLSENGLRARADNSERGPLLHWVSMRMPNRGGAAGGTPEVYFSDPDGIHVQLQDTSYCGGGGYLGDSCPNLAV